MLTRTEMSSILKWSKVIDRAHWAILPIQGAWNVLGQITFSEKDGRELAELLKNLKHWPEKHLIFVFMIASFTLTQLCDSLIVMQKTVEIIGEAYDGIDPFTDNPIHFLLPATFASRMSFMLPVSQTIGLVILEKYHIKIKDFFLAGLMPSVVAFTIVYIQSLYLTSLLFKDVVIIGNVTQFV